MSYIIYRIAGGLAHALNTASGRIMSFDLSEEEIKQLLSDWEHLGEDLSEDAASFFSARGNPNTHLCRGNLIELGMEFGFPTMVNLEINRRCSLRCLHCYIGEEDLSSQIPSIFELMPTEDLSSFLDDLRAMGVFLLVFTGGEPFVNKRLNSLLQMASDKGFVSEIFSNLQYLPSWFSELNPLESRIGRVQVSVYSSDQEVHDAITKRTGSFTRTLKNIEFLRTRRFYVEVATPLMKDNLASWKRTRDFFARLGVPQNFSWPIVNEYYSGKPGKSDLNISPEQFRQFVDENKGFLIETRFDENPNAPICEAGIALFSIVADGSVFPCSQFPFRVGNIAEQGIRAIYDSEEMGCIRGLRNIDTRLNVAHNYCVGANFSETGNPLTQPLFFVECIKTALHRRKL